jgi:hypothetical protein
MPLVNAAEDSCRRVIHLTYSLKKGFPQFLVSERREWKFNTAICVTILNRHISADSEPVCPPISVLPRRPMC